MPSRHRESTLFFPKVKKTAGILSVWHESVLTSFRMLPLPVAGSGGMRCRTADRLPQNRGAAVSIAPIARLKNQLTWYCPHATKYSAITVKKEYPWNDAAFLEVSVLCSPVVCFRHVYRPAATKMATTTATTMVDAGHREGTGLHADTIIRTVGMTGLRMAGHTVTGKSALIVTTGTIKTNKKQPVHMYPM